MVEAIDASITGTAVLGCIADMRLANVTLVLIFRAVKITSIYQTMQIQMRHMNQYGCWIEEEEKTAYIHRAQLTPRLQSIFARRWSGLKDQFWLLWWHSKELERWEQGRPMCRVWPAPRNGLPATPYLPGSTSRSRKRRRSMKQSGVDGTASESPCNGHLRVWGRRRATRPCYALYHWP